MRRRGVPAGRSATGRCCAAACDDGRAGLRRRRSHEVHVLDGCLGRTPAVERDRWRDGTVPRGAEVMIRVGARTGERMVVVSPTVGDATVPAGVQLDRRRRARRRCARAWIHEVVGRRRLRISAGSFFQARPDGAEALIRAVGRALGALRPDAGPAGRPVRRRGLFTAGLGRAPVGARGALPVVGRRCPGEPGVARRTGGAGGRRATGRRVAADVVVADPARAGLGAAGAAAVVGHRRPTGGAGELRPCIARPRRPAAGRPRLRGRRRRARRHVPPDPPHRGRDHVASGRRS